MAFFLEKIIDLEKIKIRVIFPGKIFFMETKTNSTKLEIQSAETGENKHKMINR